MASGKKNGGGRWTIFYVLCGLVIATLINNHTQLEALISHPAAPCLRESETEAAQIAKLTAELRLAKTVTAGLRKLVATQSIKANKHEASSGDPGEMYLSSAKQVTAETITQSVKPVAAHNLRPTEMKAPANPGPISQSSTKQVAVGTEVQSVKPVAAHNLRPTEMKTVLPKSESKGAIGVSMTDLIARAQSVIKTLDVVPWDWNLPGQSSLGAVTNGAMGFYKLRERNGKLPKLCSEWTNTYNVKPGHTWGALPQR
jgi:hypothetical protein